ncbi:MAG: ABC transporter permease subunit [Pseudomonadota bacterium]|jgi:ABC-2 type transport system permease protein|nr:ABC transporter permease subunit [Pseudomonadota bacterium]HPD21409.1 ABC transporter permease subunit [Deltaproteobacteria bacterium]HRS56201.1 ABC transporter permease subunit [Desulfomonilia bacterium]HRV35986.1 ABC transporter permease subunit [Desulfomonilia bacterium]
MTRTLQIFKKELKDYFVSPIAYIVICIFLLISGWFFFSTFFIFNHANLRNFFNLLPLTYSFVIPAVTMRLFAEEIHSGSYEMLLTLPVKLSDIVLGKFLAGAVFAAIMLTPTLAYAVSISFIGDLDWGPVAGGYIGAVLLGAAYSAVGVFASSLTKNQIVAFITGMVICFALTLFDKLVFFFPPLVVDVFTYIAAGYHFENISKGILDTRDVLYFASMIFAFLYGAHLVMQEKR